MSDRTLIEIRPHLSKNEEEFLVKALTEYFVSQPMPKAEAARTAVRKLDNILYNVAHRLTASGLVAPVSSPALDLVSTVDLAKEIGERFDAVIVVGVRPLSKKAELFHLDYFGGLTTCLGLAERTAARLIDQALSASDLEEGKDGEL